jgi:hypothetical protein
MRAWSRYPHGWLGSRSIARRPADIVTGIFERFEECTGGDAPDDDRAVVVVSGPEAG